MSGRPRVSVVMPAYRQANVLPGAVESLLDQELHDWELIVVDDGSPEDTAGAIARFLADPRVRLLRRRRNGGLGRAINDGLDRATAPLVSYLPCDDRVRPSHLATLVAALETRPQLIAAVARLEGPPVRMLQLVQVAHRLTGDRWTQRGRLESDDLELLFWNTLRRRGARVMRVHDARAGRHVADLLAALLEAEEEV